MSIKKSAGLLLFRPGQAGLEVLLVHPGGPFWSRRDDGAWSIPKGEVGDNEDALDAAKREFAEEMGAAVDGDCIRLTPLRQPSGKVVYGWAVQCDFDASAITSNSFSMEWPPKSGRFQDYPEIDRADWFTVETAGRKILSGQAAFLDELQKMLEGESKP
jgi:predicted NUDIX family NTP pyrophosphohydrolase